MQTITAIIQDQPGNAFSHGVDFANFAECKAHLEDRSRKVPTYATVTNDTAHIATFLDGEWIIYREDLAIA